MIAVHIKFGNIEKYFQTNKNLPKKIKSFLFNQFQEDVDFLIDLMASNETLPKDYEKYSEEKELLEDFCNQVNNCNTLEDIKNLIHPKYNCKLFMENILIQ